MFPRECLLGTVPAVAKSHWVLLHLEHREKSYTYFLPATASNTGMLKMNSGIKSCATNVTAEEYQMVLRNEEQKDANNSESEVHLSYI